MNSDKSTRVFGLDVVRALAILCVVSVHFFKHTKFQLAVFEGPSMFIQGMLKYFFSMGVPLFILLTGFLNCRKTASLRYYRGGLRVIGIYLFWSVVTCIYFLLLEKDSSVYKLVMGIFSFTTIDYAWYIEMWIGLFLLIPFLNIMWWGCPSRKHKFLLIGTLYVMTCVPIFINRYDLELVPKYWAGCYPLVYYFIGAYIAEYRPKLNCGCWLFVVLLCLVNPLFSAVFFSQHTMVQIMGEPSGAIGVIMPVLVFILCYRWEIRSNAVRWLIASVSIVSLDMYLCSYMFDKSLYPYFKETFNWQSNSQAGHYFAIVVLTIFTASYAAAKIRWSMTKLTHVAWKK